MVVKDFIDAQHFINIIQVAHVRRICEAHHKANEAYYQQIHRSSGPILNLGQQMLFTHCSNTTTVCILPSTTL